jgi:hypothetical protein
MHTLDGQEGKNQRKIMGPHNFGASALTEPPKQTASQRTAASSVQLGTVVPSGSH